MPILELSSSKAFFRSLLEIDVVDVAPTPVFALFRGLNKRMLRGVEMRARMTVLR
jgi:hypothetical protein